MKLIVTKKVTTKISTKEEKSGMKRYLNWYSIIATWFYVGRVPFMRGTFGSIASYPVYWLVMHLNMALEWRLYMLYAISSILTIVGCFAISKYHEICEYIDDSSIVIDEVVGQLLTSALAAIPILVYGDKLLNVMQNASGSVVSELDAVFIISLIIFRIIDIEKPCCIWRIDQYIRNAFGVMLDDIAAAALSGGIIYLLMRIIYFFG